MAKKRCKNTLNENTAVEIKKIIKLFKDRNFYELLDYIILLIFLSVISFIPIYKITIHLEKYFWSTSNLVLADSIKSQLPILLLFSILSITVVKWILFVRIKKGNGVYSTESKTYELVLGKRIISVKKSTAHTLILILILSLYALGRIPYWDISFAVNHPLKYNTYVGPALRMYETGDPFIIQRKYMHNPITSSLGIGTQFGNLPLLEWSLFIFFTLFANILPIEVITRLVMTLLGCVALISFYTFAKKAFSERLALLAVFILSINTIFNLASFVTVYDIINFSLTFFSLSILIDKFKLKSAKNLFLAGLLIGIGASIKENILIWSIPTAALLLLYANNYKTKAFLSNLGVFFLGVFTPYILVKTSLGKFPMKDPKFFILFLIELLLLILIYMRIKSISLFIHKSANNIVNCLHKHKYLLATIPLLLLLVLKVVYSTSISEEFLTDFRLLINIKLYLRFITEQLIPYLGVPISTIFILTFFWFVYHNKNKYHDILVVSVLSGSLFYTVVASKALFFHSYYWLFILASCILLASWGIVFMVNRYYKGSVKNAFIFLLVLSLILTMAPMVKAKLNREYPEIRDVISYLNSQDFEDGTSYIDQGNTSYLTIKTDLYKVYDYSVFAHPDFKDSVKEIGFIETMKKYKILYIVTQNSGPDYSIFANSFSNEKLQSNYLRRTDLILSSFNSSVEYQEDTQERVSILGKNHIDQQIRLVTGYGTYKIYTLTDACFDTVLE